MKCKYLSTHKHTHIRTYTHTHMHARTHIYSVLVLICAHMQVNKLGSDLQALVNSCSNLPYDQVMVLSNKESVVKT